MHRQVASWCARGASDRSMPRTRGEIPCVSSKRELFTRGKRRTQGSVTPLAGLCLIEADTRQASTQIGRSRSSLFLKTADRWWAHLWKRSPRRVRSHCPRWHWHRQVRDDPQPQARHDLIRLAVRLALEDELERDGSDDRPASPDLAVGDQLFGTRDGRKDDPLDERAGGFRRQRRHRLERIELDQESHVVRSRENEEKFNRGETYGSSLTVRDLDSLDRTRLSARTRRSLARCCCRMPRFVS